MIQECAIRFENKFALVFGQSQKVSDQMDLQKFYKLNLVVSMPVSLPFKSYHSHIFDSRIKTILFSQNKNKVWSSMEASLLFRLTMEPKCCQKFIQRTHYSQLSWMTGEKKIVWTYCVIVERSSIEKKTSNVNVSQSLKMILFFPMS